MKKLVGTYGVALLACVLITLIHGDAIPSTGFSITMGTAISTIYSTMLGSLSTTLSSSMLLSTERPYGRALAFNQVLLPLVATIVLCVAELARSSYGPVSDKLERVSENLTSEAALLTVLCLVFLIINLWFCLRGVFG